MSTSRLPASSPDVAFCSVHACYASESPESESEEKSAAWHASKE